MATLSTPRLSRTPIAFDMRLPAVAAGVAISVLLLAAIRLNPDAFRFAPFVRALIARGVFCAAVLAIAATLAGSVLPRSSLYAACMAACGGFAANAVITCVLSVEYDAVLLKAADDLRNQRGAITI